MLLVIFFFRAICPIDGLRRRTSDGHMARGPGCDIEMIIITKRTLKWIKHLQAERPTSRPGPFSLLRQGCPEKGPI